ncbi:atp-binding cassette sub-family b [Holotrichia oblita]|nr:atp-binding cassette sub-family b [Holotrichia oblita]
MKETPDAAGITGKPEIIVRNLGLTVDEKVILKDIDLTLPYGKKLGVMGRTGSGKTALLKCLSRFFDATTGEVFINGKNIKFLKIEEVRRQFGWVYQDVFLFSNTVDANIAFYDPEKDSKEKVRKCAECAEAHSFIMKLSDGYETVVGEKGHGLSGGQKQRLSIARALYKDAPILLLDDATSALDLSTEAKILSNLNKDYPDITLVISAHRASSVVNCDEIIYLENGIILERGTHTELMKLKGAYAKVFEEQQASYKEAL